MSKNAIGTLFIIGFIFLTLILFWMTLTALFYVTVCFLFEFRFSLKIYFLLFFAIMLFRMFYPKNVFK